MTAQLTLNLHQLSQPTFLVLQLVRVSLHHHSSQCSLVISNAPVTTNNSTSIRPGFYPHPLRECKPTDLRLYPVIQGCHLSHGVTPDVTPQQTLWHGTLRQSKQIQANGVQKQGLQRQSITLHLQFRPDPHWDCPWPRWEISVPRAQIPSFPITTPPPATAF